MGDQIKEEDAFDVRFLKIFNKGDLVSWKTNLDKKREYGIITKIYSEEMPSSSNRKFMFAKIRKPDGAVVVYMLSSLTKES